MQPAVSSFRARANASGDADASAAPEDAALREQIAAFAADESRCATLRTRGQSWRLRMQTRQLLCCCWYCLYNCAMALPLPHRPTGVP